MLGASSAGDIAKSTNELPFAEPLDYRLLIYFQLLQGNLESLETFTSSAFRRILHLLFIIRLKLN